MRARWLATTTDASTRAPTVSARTTATSDRAMTLAAPRSRSALRDDLNGPAGGSGSVAAGIALGFPVMTATRRASRQKR